METKKSNRGGARRGAGRPPLTEPKKVVAIAFTQGTAEMLRELRAEGVKITALLEDFIRAAYNSKLIFGIPQPLCVQVKREHLRNPK